MAGVRGWIARLAAAGWDAARRHAPRSSLAALGVIAALLAAVTVLRWFFDGAGQAVALLYVIPITLGALRFGRRGGAGVAGCGMTAFVVLEGVHARGDLDLTGWVGPLLVMVLAGGLVGHLSDLAAQREADQRLEAQRNRQLEELCDAQRSAIEASDSIVQQVAAARWLLEVGRSSEALAALGDTAVAGIAQVSSALAPLPDDPGLRDCTFAPAPPAGRWSSTPPENGITG